MTCRRPYWQWQDNWEAHSQSLKSIGRTSFKLHDSLDEGPVYCPQGISGSLPRLGPMSLTEGSLGCEISGHDSHAEISQNTVRNQFSSFVLGQDAFRLTGGRLVHRIGSSEYRIRNKCHSPSHFCDTSLGRMDLTRLIEPNLG